MVEHSEVDPTAFVEDRDYEAALRPKRLAEFEGQPRVREHLVEELLPRAGVDPGGVRDHAVHVEAICEHL